MWANTKEQVRNESGNKLVAKDQLLNECFEVHCVVLGAVV